MIESITYEELDRTLFEHVRLSLVELGHLPDIVTFVGDPTGYATAKVALGSNLIEIHGVGYGDTRDDKKPNEIVIDRSGAKNGSIGASPAYQFEAYDAGSGSIKYRKYELPDGSRDVDYTIRTITNRASTERIMTEILYGVFGQNRYIQVFNGDLTVKGTQKLFIVSNGDVNVSTIDFMERLHSFIATDVWLDKKRLIIADVVPLSSAKFVISLSSNSSVGYDNPTDEIETEIVE